MPRTVIPCTAMLPAVRITVATLLLLLLGATRASAQPGLAVAAPDTVRLTLDRVRQLVLTSDPGYLAAREETAIARGALRQASILPFNPDLSLAAPGTGPTAPRNPLEVTLSQEIEWAGQRGLRRRAANAALTGARASVGNSARERFAEASGGFFAAEASARRLDVMRASAELGRRLLEAVHLQLREGEISALEANLAEIEAGRAQARVISEQRLLVARQVELKRALGLSPDAVVVIESSTIDADSIAPSLPDSLVSAAIVQRADIRALDALVGETVLRAQFARREALPNLRLGLYVEQMPGEAGLRYGPSIGFGIPLWNRNQGTTDMLTARRRQVEQERRAAVLRARAEIVAAANNYAGAASEVAVYARTVLQPARTNSALLETAYRAGKLPLPTLLLLRNQLLDAELGYWDAWLTRQRARIDLESALGGRPVDDADVQPLSTTSQDPRR